jgi:ribonuclease D
VTEVCSSHTPPASAPKTISKEAINALPMISWEGPVELVESVEAAEAAVFELQKESLLGFDTETRPCFKKGEYHPPALVQLANAHKVWLFRICRMDTLKPLIPLLENPAVLKSGVAIQDDVKELRRLEEFSPAGFVDITSISVPAGIGSRGLRALCGILMGGRISKKAQVSNWAREKLDARQINYAATDAWISRELYLKACAIKENSSL